MSRYNGAGDPQWTQSELDFLKAAKMPWDKEPRAWRMEDGSYLDLDCAVMMGGIGATW
jgi:hypothetical protein